MRQRLAKLFVGLALVLTCVAALASIERDLETPRQLHETPYVQAAQCARCHPDHTRSFERTFHRTMTQAANEHSVRGDFNGTTLEYFGVRSTMRRGERGEHIIEYQLPGAPPERLVVEMTVGSRRYQQYIARRGAELVRLPIAYHIEEQRWFHMNGAFLTPDPPEAALARADYERHVTRWNDNCVFCHNVGPNPGKHRSAEGGDAFDTHVAELGIACEACHGPGQAHERANHNPLRRYVLHTRARPDPTIVNPAQLSPERSLDVCGRCHGQRITDHVEPFLRDGDRFVPGDDLALYSAPLWRDTTLNGEQVFAPRFWPDGTPRLTAYEYQGVLQSACAQRGNLTCLSCHGMHEGDPRGQIRPSKTGAAMCSECHASLAAPAAQARHSGHDALGPDAPACVDCHMPKLVYGVLEAHRSHRIESPSPSQAAAAQRPDACTQCHVDKTRAWASREHARLWPAKPGRAPLAQAEEDSPWSEMETQLFAGDPIERALAAAALSRQPTPVERERRLALLLDVMEHDPYPAIRHLALRSARHVLGDTAPLRDFVPEEPASRRHERLAAVRAQFRLSADDAMVSNTLRARASALAIEIGE